MSIDYIDKKFQGLQNEFIRQISSAKRSISYDLDKKIIEVKHTFIVNQPTTIPQISIEKLKEGLNIANSIIGSFFAIGKCIKEISRK